MAADQQNAPVTLDQYIVRLLDRWAQHGLPSREKLVQAAEEILAYRLSVASPGLWPQPPLMMTATIDDGFGHGLDLIHRYAEAVGLRVKSLGRLRAPKTIVAACQRHLPDLLGMTILQFDSEDAVLAIRRECPSTTTLIAGGPLFGADPEFASRAGIDVAVKDVGGFLKFLLTYTPGDRHRSADASREKQA
jgi:methylmalonyl-CoA mutase cobalamin-binding subunit